MGALQSPGCATSGACFMGDGDTGVFFTATVTANGGSLAPSYQPYTWSVVGGHLPAGLSLQEASTQEAWVLGTPATAGTSTLTAQVTDNAGTTARQSFTITDVTVTFILLNAAGQQVGGPAGCAPPATGTTATRSPSARASTRPRSR
jgi:hypothetical protein